MVELNRRHPDVFTAAEAVEYLQLDSERVLESLRSKFGLIGYSTFGKEMRYMRKDLDACLLRMTGVMPSQERMRLAK